ncbi:MAG: adenine deaminase [Bdellovibrionales bacterium]|nr:adenine deaminase [Bdellovibrionales bacterium]
MSASRTTPDRLRRRIDGALGKIPCDLVVKDVTTLDVFSGTWRVGDVAVIDGAIVGTDPGYSGTREISGRGKFLVPGFIDAHVHLESSLMMPSEFERTVLARGTTAAICDPHELANVMGVPGIEAFLRAAERTKLDLRVMLSSCVPATHLETNGGGTLGVKDLVPLRAHPKALGLAEMMNFPGLLAGDPAVLEKVAAFSDGVMDGHAPLLRGNALSAYAACGISSCHESSEAEEAAEKLRKGVAVWIREGSVAKDLAALAPLLNVGTSTTLGFCTDDRNPLDILEEGHLDHLVREAIRHGVAPEVAYRAASWSVARHYGLDRGSDRTGAIAPGYRADFVLLDDAKSVSIATAFRAGRPADELEFDSARFGDDRNSIHSKEIAASDLASDEGNVHVIEVEAGKILTGRSVKDSRARGVARLAVKERYGKDIGPATGYVSGFGEHFSGAIASSVGHDSHNLIAVGAKTADMATAMNALRKSGGGFCVVKDGAVLAELALPMGGLMTNAPATEIRDRLAKLKAASRSVGCELPEPFLQLAFLSLPVIPSLKLTDRGLVDVDAFRIIGVRAS